MNGNSEAKSLIMKLRDSSSDVRMSAVCALTQICALGKIVSVTDEVIAALIVALRDSYWRVRASAAMTLGHIGPAAKQAVPALINALQEEDIRLDAATALGAIGPVTESVIPELIKTMKDADSRISSCIREVLSEFAEASEETVSALMVALNDEYLIWPDEFCMADSVPDNVIAAVMNRFVESTISSDTSNAVLTLEIELGVPLPVIYTKISKALHVVEDNLLFSRIAEAFGELGSNGKQAVPTLIKALNNEYWNVRLSAVEALEKIGPVSDEVIPALATALEDKHRFVGTSAAEALGEFGPAARQAIPALEKALDSKSIRSEVARALGYICPSSDKLVYVLRMSLKDEDNITFRCAADSIARAEPVAKEAVPILIKALDNHMSVFREPAAKVLGDIGPVSHDVIPALAKALEDRDWNVCQTAAIALGKIGPAAKKAVPSLIKALELEHVREDGAIALCKIGNVPKRIITGLIRKLKDDNEYYNVRLRAVWTLGGFGPAAKEAVSALIREFHNEDWDMRSSAVKAIGKIGPVSNDVIPALITALEDEYCDSESAAKALGNFGLAAREAVPALTRAVEKDDALGTSSSAIVSLGKIGPVSDDVIPALIKAWEKGNRGAADALGTFGIAAKEAIPELLKGLDKEDHLTRLAAVRALGNIGTGQVISALKGSLEDIEKDVREAAREGLGKIETPDLSDR